MINEILAAVSLEKDRHTITISKDVASKIATFYSYAKKGHVLSRGFEVKLINVYHVHGGLLVDFKFLGEGNVQRMKIPAPVPISLKTWMRFKNIYVKLSTGDLTPKILVNGDIVEVTFPKNRIKLKKKGFFQFATFELNKIILTKNELNVDLIGPWDIFVPTIYWGNHG